MLALEGDEGLVSNCPSVRRCSSRCRLKFCRHRQWARPVSRGQAQVGLRQLKSDPSCGCVPPITEPLEHMLRHAFSVRRGLSNWTPLWANELSFLGPFPASHSFRLCDQFSATTLLKGQHYSQFCFPLVDIVFYHLDSSTSFVIITGCQFC